MGFKFVVETKKDDCVILMFFYSTSNLYLTDSEFHTAQNYTSDNLKVLEMGLLRFRKRELKVTFTRPFNQKGHLYMKVDFFSWKGLVKVM